MNEQKMTERAIEIREGYIQKWLAQGVSSDKIRAWADDPIKRGLINAMAMFDAADEQGYCGIPGINARPK